MYCLDTQFSDRVFIYHASGFEFKLYHCSEEKKKEIHKFSRIVCYCLEIENRNLKIE